MNPILAELQREQAETEALIEQCYHEIKACRVVYESTGDGSSQWRKKFDERFHLMRDLKRIKEQIAEAMAIVPPQPGQAIEVFFNDTLQGRTTVRAIHQRLQGGYIVSVNPLTMNSLPLAFDEKGRCILKGFEDFTIQLCAAHAHNNAVRQAA